MTENPQRILVTADLHFGSHPEGDVSAHKLADFVAASGADVLAVAGDVADSHTDRFAACLDLFEDFHGLRLVVPGNHDLWSAGDGSLARYQEVLPRAASEHGFTMLDGKPLVVGRTGFIGNIGWYDYSFQNPELGLTFEEYAGKELPGCCVWNDLRYIDWEFSDAEFTEECLQQLAQDYQTIEPQVESVIAVLHHVPFRELLYGPSRREYEFCRAYMGSTRLGELLLKCPKVRYVFCGHRHGEDGCETGHLEAFVAGSDYFTKRLIELDLSTGRHKRHEFHSGGAPDSAEFGP